MNTVENNNNSKITLVLNICTALMVIFAIFNIYTSNKYISQLVMQGFKPSEQMVDVIKFYLNAATPYVFYTICLLVLSIIVKKIDRLIGRDNNLKGYKVYAEKQKITEEEVEDEEDIVEMLLREKDL